MIHNTSVDLFRYTHVEAAVTSFHMEGRNFATFGGNDRHAAVGVAEDEKSLRLNLGQHAINGNNDVTDGFRTCCTSSIQKVVGFTDTEILKENLVQFIVIILPGVH
ncbi:hypothetical protein D3C86_1723550 [compost metagenome]